MTKTEASVEELVGMIERGELRPLGLPEIRQRRADSGMLWMFGILPTVRVLGGQANWKCSNICSNFYFNHRNPLSGTVFNSGSASQAARISYVPQARFTAFTLKCKQPLSEY